MGAKLDTGVGRKRGRPDVNAEPNVIPFIDVMLVLLIIFMVTAPIASVDIKTEMPNLDIASEERPPKPVWVTLIDGEDCLNIDKTGPALIGGVPITSCPAVAVMEKQVAWSELGAKTVEALIENNRLNAKETSKPNFGQPEWVYTQRVYLRASGATKYRNITRAMAELIPSAVLKIALVAKDPTP
jgi:biopolymer transport protein ExbD